MPIHRKLTGTNIHRPYSFEYADETARLAGTGYVATDLYKLARQLDDDSFWILTDLETPTWTQMSSAVEEEPVTYTSGYVFGGFNTVKDCDEYTPDSWTSKTDMPSPGRAELTATNILEKAYLFCGQGEVARIVDTEEYDPDTWTGKTDAPTPARANHAASTISDKGYIYGGNAGANLQDCDEYDPDTWTNKTDMPSPVRQGLTASTILDKGYIYGGVSTSEHLDCDEYDPDTWTSKTDMPSPARTYHAAATMDDKGYIFCGYTGTANKDTDEYDPDTWTSKTDALVVNYRLAAAVVEGKCHVFSGYSDRDNNDEYVVDTWTSKANMPLPDRYYIASCAL